MPTLDLFMRVLTTQPPKASGRQTSSFCVVHLLRYANGVEPFRRFLAAYQRNPGGLEHDLLLACKGFPNDQLPPEYLEAISGVAYRTLFLSDAGFDIVPYFASVRHTDYEVYCFLNSFSEPLDHTWLRKLHTCLEKPGVDLVGATASWGSVHSHMLLHFQEPSAYKGLLDRTIPPPKYGPLLESLRRLKHHLVSRSELRRQRYGFGPFPTYHMRSNAFMLRRDTMQQVQHEKIRTKADALAFESGRNSLTAQVLARGKSVLVVGRDGKGYAKEFWPDSNTFWQSEQENLLVADNQTSNYAAADPALRRFYSRYAWGPHARSGSAGKTAVN